MYLFVCNNSKSKITKRFVDAHSDSYDSYLPEKLTFPICTSALIRDHRKVNLKKNSTPLQITFDFLFTPLDDFLFQWFSQKYVFSNFSNLMNIKMFFFFFSVLSLLAGGTRLSNTQPPGFHGIRLHITWYMHLTLILISFLVPTG